MEPLKTNKLLLTWLGMCAAKKSTDKKTKMAYIGVASTIFAFIILCLISNIAFIVKFLSTNLKGALFSIMTISGYAAMLYTQINAFNMRHKINGIFERLSKILNESE